MVDEIPRTLADRLAEHPVRFLDLLELLLQLIDFLFILFLIKFTGD